MSENMVFCRSVKELNIPEADYRLCRIRKWRNGLLVRMPDRLDRAVMALPALAAIKKIIPEYCGLFVITWAANLQLYRALPWVDDIIAIKNPLRLWSKDERKKIKQLHAGAALLFNDPVFRDIAGLKLAGIPVIYGEAAFPGSLFLTAKFASGKLKTSHWIWRYGAIAKAMGGDVSSLAMPDLVMPLRADELPGRISSVFYHPLLLTVVPGSGSNGKSNLSASEYAGVASWWIRHGGIIALCGNVHQRRECEEIARRLPEKKCFDFCGKADILSLLYLFRYSAFSIVDDPEIAYLGAMQKAPGLSTFSGADLSIEGIISPEWMTAISPVTPAVVIKLMKKRASELKLPLQKKVLRQEHTS